MTVWSSTFWTFAIQSFRAAELVAPPFRVGALFNNRFVVNTTSSAVYGTPSLQVTPLRILSVHWSSELLAVMLSPTQGTICPVS